MLPGMSNWKKCVLPFTVLVALFFYMGHAAAQTAPTNTQEQGAPEAPTEDEKTATPPDGAAVERQTSYVDTDPSAVTLWRTELAPDGTWVEDPVYGLVWIPDASVVGPDFVPYATAGYWTYTSEGQWVWVSEYGWGSVVFHYGRWVWIPERGWAWIPGRMYAPAWVVWRVGDPGYGYVGWAPMPPTYYWYGGVAVSLWVVPPPYYVYCESSYVFVHDVHAHRLRGNRARAAARHSHPYRPSHATTGGRRAAMPHRGPSPQEAGVPPNAVPRTPARPHPGAAAAPSTGHRFHATRPAPAGSLAARPKPGAAGVSRPVYWGRPSRGVPIERRAAPLASRPIASRSIASRSMASPPSGPHPTLGGPHGGRRVMPGTHRSLGRTVSPSRVSPSSAGGWGAHDGASSSSLPRLPRPTVRPAPQSGSRPVYGPSTGPSRTGPSRRVAPKPPTRVGKSPSAHPHRPSRSRPSRPSPSRQPRYHAPSHRSVRPSSRPSYSGHSIRAPAPSGQKKSYRNNKHGGRKSRSHGRVRRHRR